MAENSSAGGGNRLKQIVGVLHAHQVVKGLTPEKLRLIFEDLGPTFIKFGQIMSMRSDMLPMDYCKELRRLRTDVHPMPYGVVAAEVEKEYGKPLNEVFAKIDPHPLGSASIAQVHYAELKSGDKVVIKVKRPGIYEIMARDAELLKKVSGLMRIVGKTGSTIDFNMVIDEMWAAAQQEMDFLNEARQIQEFRRLNANVAYISIPRVYSDYTTPSVFVMEYIKGIPIDDVKSLAQDGYDCNEIGLKLAENYVKQIIDDGFFHADPHPGNIRVRGGKIVWLDMGMMGRLSARDQQIFRNGIAAAICGDVNELEDLLLAFCSHASPVDHALLYTDIDDMLSKYANLEIGSMNMMKIRDDIMSIATRHELAMPPGVSMLGRGLVTIEGVVSTISPEINVMQIMINHVSNIVLNNFDISKEFKKSAMQMFRSGRRIPNIPSQVSELLKMGIKGQTKTNIEITGSRQPLNALGKMADRLALALIEAALLAGSAVLCTSDLPKCFLGIPAIGAAGLALAFVLGGYLFWDIFIHKR